MQKENKYKIGAIIVLFYPNKALINKMLSLIKNSVHIIYLIDNTPADKCQSFSFLTLKKGSSITYKALKNNYGIAAAQNIGIKLACKDKCDHIIFFDQDSLPDFRMINKLLSGEEFLLKSGVNVGAVGPIYVDYKTSKVGKIMKSNLFSFFNNSKIKNHNFASADILISSGCLVRSEVFKKTGLMKAEYFIDAVDTEWCLRANHYGFKHFVINDAFMRHSMGKSYFTFGFISLPLYDELRHYYSVRNYSNLLLNKHISFGYKFLYLFKLPVYILIFSFNSNKPFSSLKFLLLGFFNGIRGKLGKSEYQGK